MYAHYDLEGSRAMLKLGDRPLHRLHFVGIGGAGMSAIAHVALELGVEVTGSDLVLSETTTRLEERGARVVRGHDASNILDPDAIVVSTAIAPDNPEVAEAKRRGIKVLHRAEMLAIIMEQKKGIAISGTHGKTTTTSMTAVVFERLGLRPTWLVGGEVRDLGAGAGYGEGDYLIAEADESDRSFLKLSPFVAVATNIDNDHLDHYGSFDHIVEAFEEFLGRTRPGGFSVLCVDDPNLARMAPRLPGRVMTYSAAGPGKAHYQVTDFAPTGWGSTFKVSRSGTPLGEFSLTVPGRHNASNAAAVIAVAVELGLPVDGVAAALKTFSGAGRRLQKMGQAGGVEVLDDYAHHPTEIMTTLRTVKNLARSGRVVVVFQPHRFTRTKALYAEFGKAFADADVVVLTDIYPATEPPIPGVTGELVYRHFQTRPGQTVSYVPALTEVASHLASEVHPGDLVLTMGAGNVRQVGPELLSLLDGSTPPAARS